MAELINWFKGNVDQAVLLGQVFLIVFCTLLVSLIAKLLCARLEKRAKRTSNIWDDVFVNAVSRPMMLAIWVIGISFAGDLIDSFSDKIELVDLMNTARHLGILGALAWFLVRFTSLAESELVKASRVDRTTADAIGKLLRFSILITMGLVVLQELGISISGVLAFGGVGGIVLGLAAKDLLSNFFGGFMVYLDRPFQVGDWIRSPSAALEGTVEQIGWRLTRIRNFESQPIYVPNSLFTQVIIENPSRMKNRRIKTTVGIRYDDFHKLPAILLDIKDLIKNHEQIDQSMSIYVNFDQYADSSLNIYIAAFVKTRDLATFRNIQEEILLKVGEIIENHNAEMAFPTQTLHLFNDSAEQAEAPCKQG